MPPITPFIPTSPLRARLALIAVLVATASVACSDAESQPGASPQRICSIVHDEPVAQGSKGAGFGRTAAGESFAMLEDGTLLRRGVDGGWSAEQEAPPAGARGPLQVALSGAVAVFAAAPAVNTEPAVWIRLPGGVFTPAVVFDPLTFFGEPALQFTPDDTLFVSFVKRIEGPEAWQHELHRIDVPAGSMELLEATTEFEVVYHAESRSSYWWATTTEGSIDVRHGADRATISIDSEGISLLASSLRLTSSRGRGAAHWSSSDSQGVAWWAPDTSYETAPGVWSAPVRSTPDRETECPDDAHPGDSCAIDDHRFYVGHVGGDALDLLGFEHTARGDAVFQCSGPYEPSDQQVCQWHDWSPDVESRSWLVAARGDGSFERLLDVTDYHSVGYSVQRGTDGDLHLLLTTTTLPVEQIEVRYVRVACKGPSL